MPQTKHHLIELSLDMARRLSVFKQALLDTIRQIGLLQLDTINAVARSHYLVTLSRVGLYDPADLGCSSPSYPSPV
jgi:uncharacterized protein YcaQ